MVAALLLMLELKRSGRVCIEQRNNHDPNSNKDHSTSSLSEEDNSTYSGLTIITAKWGDSGTLTVQGLLSVRWVVIWSSVQGKRSDYSLTHELGPTQVIFCFFH